MSKSTYYRRKAAEPSFDPRHNSNAEGETISCETISCGANKEPETISCGANIDAAPSGLASRGLTRSEGAASRPKIVARPEVLGHSGGQLHDGGGSSAGVARSPGKSEFADAIAAFRRMRDEEEPAPPYIGPQPGGLAQRALVLVRRAA
jgi:hypothetical protein